MKVSIQGNVLDVDLVAIESVLSRMTAAMPDRGNKVVPNDLIMHKVAIAIGTHLGTVITLSEAWQLWFLVSTVSDGTKKQQANNAELAYWYKINPLQVTEIERMGMLANLPMLQARERISKGDYNNKDPKGVYAIFKLAYGDEDLAQRRATEAAKAALNDEAKRGRR